MLLYAFQDEAGQWHGDPDTETLDGQPGIGFLCHRPAPGITPLYAGERLRVRYGPCGVEASAEEVQLEDGVRVFLTWRVLELLEGGSCPPQQPNAYTGAPLPAVVPSQPKAAARTGPRSWTAEEDELCRTRVKAGDTPEAIAAQLRRGVPSVRFHLAKLHLVPFPADLLPAPDPNRPRRSAPDPDSHRAQASRRHPRAYLPWTPEEDEIAIRMADENTSIEEIAAALQRQPGAVDNRLEKLGAHPDNDPRRPLPSWDDEDTGTVS